MKTDRENHKKYKCDHCDKTCIVANTMDNHLKVYQKIVKINKKKVCTFGKEFMCMMKVEVRKMMIPTNPLGIPHKCRNFQILNCEKFVSFKKDIIKNKHPSSSEKCSCAGFDF
jgi:hypothetical protein